MSRGCSAGGRLSAASARWAAATAAVETAATATPPPRLPPTTSPPPRGGLKAGKGVETGKRYEWGETELRGWRLPMRVESDRATTARSVPLTATASKRKHSAVTPKNRCLSDYQQNSSSSILEIVRAHWPL